MQLSGHYWTVVSDLIQPDRMKKKRVYNGKKPMLLSTDVKTDEITESDQDSLLAEAQMTLANVALYNNNATQALQHLSQIKTPQAAWNQSQVCLYSYTCMYMYVHVCTCTYVHIDTGYVHVYV